MARVYLAEDLTLGRRVAIKEIEASPDLRDDEKARMLARFVREYQVTAGLEHPNVVTIFDVGERDGEPFIAMEYVRGPSLETVLDEQVPMTAGQAFDLFVPIADALDHAHRDGIVHRDLKPSNVLLTEAETPKITDFGLAKVASTTVLTRASSIVGTPAYMSPEQVTGHDMSGASDQFALATILYRALTGERPFTANTATTIMYRIVNEDPVPPHHINRLLPEAASRAVLRGLAKAADDRFTTCRDLVQAVVRALQEDASTPASGAGAPESPAGRAGAEAGSEAGRPTEPAARKAKRSKASGASWLERLGRWFRRGSAAAETDAGDGSAEAPTWLKAPEGDPPDGETGADEGGIAAETLRLQGRD